MKRNKFLSIILAVACAITMSSVSVFAIDDVEVPADENTVELQAAPAEEPEAVVEEPEVVAENAGAFDLIPTVADGSAVIFWKNIDGVDVSAYTVNGLPAGAEVETPVVGLSKTSASITGLTNDETYDITVSYEAADGSTVVSNPAAITPAAITTKVEAKATSDYKSITLRWKPVDPTVNQTYVIERKVTKDGEYEVRLDNVLRGPEDIDEDGYVTFRDGSSSNPLEAETTHYYKVYVKNCKDTTVSDATYKQAVRQGYIYVTAKTTKTLYCHCGGHSAKKYTLKAGTRLKTDGYGSGKYQFHKDVSGKSHLFYLMRVSTKNADFDYQNEWDYTKYEATNYINHGAFTSKTNYLIWANEYCQQIYLLKKVNGKWSCYDTWQISTGKANTPSPTGTTKTTGHHHSSRHGIKYWTCYSSHNAFHSIHYSSWAKTLGKPASGGCIRNGRANGTDGSMSGSNDRAYKIYKLPLKTKVIVK